MSKMPDRVREMLEEIEEIRADIKKLQHSTKNLEKTMLKNK